MKFSSLERKAARRGYLVLLESALPKMERFWMLKDCFRSYILSRDVRRGGNRVKHLDREFLLESFHLPVRTLLHWCMVSK